MEQNGIVIKEDGEYIEVATIRASACGTDCSSCSASCAESKPFTLRTLNTISAKVGDRVEIKMNAKSVLSYMCLVYGLPLVFFLIGIIFFSYVLNIFNINNGEVLSFVGALIIMAVSFFIIKKMDLKFKNVAQNNIILSKI